MKTSASLIIAALFSATAAQGTTYDTWKSQVFTVGEAANPLVTADLADPDKDGFNNLLEYAMNGDPKMANAALLPVGGRAAAGGALTLQYKRRREALDLDYVVEVSSDLVTWSGGFANVWTTDVVPSDSITVSGVSQVVADAVTATSQTAVGNGDRGQCATG